MMTRLPLMRHCLVKGAVPAKEEHHENMFL